MKTEIQNYYSAIVEQEWPAWMAGMLIAIIALMIFLWQSPWGIAAGYHNWGDWFYYLVGVFDERPLNSWLHPVSLSDAGMNMPKVWLAEYSWAVVRQWPKDVM